MSQAHPTQDQFHPDEWQLRVDLAACYRLVALYGWSDLVFTHISAKLPASVAGEEHQFLINPYGLMFDEITASSLVKIDMQCNKQDESKPTPSTPQALSFTALFTMFDPMPVACCTRTRAQAWRSVHKNTAFCPSANKAPSYWRLWPITTTKASPYETMKKHACKKTWVTPIT